MAKKDNQVRGPATGNASASTNEIYRRFLRQLNWLERLLLFMSKTDLFILQFCTRSTRMTLASVGAMVVITGILAFTSSFFAIKNSFFMEQSSAMSWIVPFCVACIYAGAIMAFDREVVSATDKRAAWIRVPFAIMIGIVISYPIELQMQHGRITAEINEMAEARNKDKRDAITRLDKENETVKESLIGPLLAKQKNLQELVKQELASADLEGQSEHGLCREICTQHKANAAEYQRQLDQLAIQLKEEEKNILNNEAIVKNDKAKQELDAEIEADKNRSHDLLSQAVALHSIYKSEAGADAFILGWALRIFFICFEMFPILIKMTMPYTEYNAYLDARMRLNVNKIIGASNYKLEYYRDNPDKIHLDNTEITDMLAMVTEDREIDNMHEHEEKRRG